VPPLAVRLTARLGRCLRRRASWRRLWRRWATALRLARKQYVQGSDGPVRTMELVKIDGKWYAPSAAITVVEPTREDIAAQVAMDAKREAVAKAKAAGLTDADLAALGLRA